MCFFVMVPDGFVLSLTFFFVTELSLSLYLLFRRLKKVCSICLSHDYVLLSSTVGFVSLLICAFCVKQTGEAGSTTLVCASVFKLIMSRCANVVE